jgi:hypothetical protein
VSPACTILVNKLCPAWQKLLSIFIGDAKNICSGFVGIFGRYTLRMHSEIPEHGLDEQIVCGDSHGSMVPTAGLLVYLTPRSEAGSRLGKDSELRSRLLYLDV